MAEKREIMKRYWQTKEVFADIINCVKDEDGVKAEQLRDIGTEIEELLQNRKDGKKARSAQEGRPYLCAMEDEKTIYVLLGVDEEVEACGMMPAQTIFYAALLYREQIKKIRQAHRMAKEPIQGNYQEHYALRPVVIVVLYLSAEQWPGPRSLQQMMAKTGGEEPGSGWHLNLLEPCAVSEKRLQACRTGVREVLAVLRCAKEKEKLKKLLQSEPYQALAYEVAKVLETVLGLELGLEGEKVNMMKAMENLLQDERFEAMQKGYTEGMVAAVKALMSNTSWAADRALKAVGVPAEQHAKYCEVLGVGKPAAEQPPIL